MKKIKLNYIIILVIVTVVAVAVIVLYNNTGKDTDAPSISSTNTENTPLTDPGPTSIACSDSSDCASVCTEDECLLPSCNKTTKTCICLGIC